jgi:hypothetical protein
MLVDEKRYSHCLYHIKSSMVARDYLQKSRCRENLHEDYPMSYAGRAGTAWPPNQVISIFEPHHGSEVDALSVIFVRRR